MKRSDNTTGALIMVASMASFTLSDACIKLLSGVLPLSQVLFLRGILTALMMAAILWWIGRLHTLPPRHDWPMIGLRTIGETGAAYFFLTALFNMPLANVTAILQAIPLSITLAAAVFLREPIGWRRMIAILVGFAGVLLIVRPGASDFNSYSYYALGAVGFVTLRDLATRRISKDTHSMWISFMNATSVMIFFGIGSLWIDWQPVTTQSGSLILAAAVLIIGGYLFSVMVMRVGEISFVAPFRYTGLIWALLLGLFVFGHWPDQLTLIGAAIVVGSGIFMLWRESVLAGQTAAARDPRGH